MGRAIDMEKDIDSLKREVKELKDILNDILNEVKKDDKKDAKKEDKDHLNNAKDMSMDDMQ